MIHARCNRVEYLQVNLYCMYNLNFSIALHIIQNILVGRADVNQKIAGQTQFIAPRTSFFQ